MAKKNKAINHFRQNRNKVQQAFIETGFLVPLTEVNLPIEIYEKGKSAKLKKVILDNFPVSDDIRPKSWRINLELEQSILASPQHSKTTEIVLALFTYDALVFFMIEMKSSLQSRGDSGLDKIQQKLEHTMGRIGLLIPSYIFDHSYNDIPIEYKGVIFYNKDQVSLIPDDLEKDDMYKALKENKNRLYLDNPLIGNSRLEVFFHKNPDRNSETFKVDFNHIFPSDNYDFQAEYTEFTCPKLELLPKTPRQ